LRTIACRAGRSRRRHPSHTDVPPENSGQRLHTAEHVRCLTEQGLVGPAELVREGEQLVNRANWRASKRRRIATESRKGTCRRSADRPASTTSRSNFCRVTVRTEPTKQTLNAALVLSSADRQRQQPAPPLQLPVGRSGISGRRSGSRPCPTRPDRHWSTRSSSTPERHRFSTLRRSTSARRMEVVMIGRRDNPAGHESATSATKTPATESFDGQDTFHFDADSTISARYAPSADIS
jgi:hypothetical protein